MHVYACHGDNGNTVFLTDLKKEHVFNLTAIFYVVLRDYFYICEQISMVLYFAGKWAPQNWSHLKVWRQHCIFKGGNICHVCVILLKLKWERDLELTPRREWQTLKWFWFLFCVKLVYSFKKSFSIILCIAYNMYLVQCGVFCKRANVDEIGGKIDLDVNISTRLRVFLKKSRSRARYTSGV